MSDNRKAWTSQEDHAINTLVKKHGTHRWSQISKRMLDHFGPPGRTGKQCRERWHNHLNPKINKQDWTAQQQQILFDLHQKYGNKWKSIALHLHGRTDNDIKNKFYSSMRKKLRKINKLLGVKNSTSQVRQIKPKVLSNIIAAATSEDAEVKSAYQQLSKLLFCKDEKKLSKIIKGQDKEKIIQLIQKISSINQIYLQKKDTDRPLTRKSSSTKEKQIYQSQQKSRPKLKRRISLRKKQTTKSQKQNKLTKDNESMMQDQEKADSNFNFSFNFAESNNRQFFSPGFHSFTPVMFKKNSTVSNGGGEQQQQQWRCFDSSPMLTRSLARTPKHPTPGFSFNQTSMILDVKNNQISRPQTYNQVLINLKKTVEQNTSKRS